jgi:hypothetical protein
MRHTPASAQPQARAERPGRAAWPGLQPLLLRPGLALGGLLLGGLVLAAPASQLPDPTRPPVALQMATAAQDMAQRLQPGETAEAAAPAPLPVLQGVQIGAHGSASALLDGQLLAVGDQLGDLKVVAIDRQGVTLRGNRGEQRLSLLSGEAKQPAGSNSRARSAGLVPTGRRAGVATAPQGGPVDALGNKSGNPPTNPPTNPSTTPPAERPVDAPADPPAEPRPAVRKSMRPMDPATLPALATPPPSPPPPTAPTPRADPARPATPLANLAATAVPVADQTRP